MTKLRITSFLAAAAAAVAVVAPAPASAQFIDCTNPAECAVAGAAHTACKTVYGDCNGGLFLRTLVFADDSQRRAIETACFVVGIPPEDCPQI